MNRVIPGKVMARSVKVIVDGANRVNHYMSHLDSGDTVNIQLQ